MQLNYIPPDRQRKARDYLRRVKKHCDSPLSPLYDTWTRIGTVEQGSVWELTAKDFRLINNICKAVYTLGGACYLPKTEYATFSGEHRTERHAVFVIRFCLNLD